MLSSPSHNGGICEGACCRLSNQIQPRSNGLVMYLLQVLLVLSRTIFSTCVMSGGKVRNDETRCYCTTTRLLVLYGVCMSRTVFLFLFFRVVLHVCTDSYVSKTDYHSNANATFESNTNASRCPSCLCDRFNHQSKTRTGDPIPSD